MTHSIIALVVALLGLAAGAPARAADCSAPYAVGYRVLTMHSGRKLAVWYPATGGEQPFAYSRSGHGLRGSVARDAPPAACPRVPLVLFSHGFGACALQSTYITEQLARQGYVVAAPDHRDATTCSIDGTGLRLQNLHTDRPLLDPASWSEHSEIDRLRDLREAIQQVANNAALARIADTTRVGAIGHSLGGYAVLGMAGGWPTWRTPEVKAVVALSPFATPFIVHGTLSHLAVPAMYQGAEFDLGITANMEGPKGAFATSPAPKYFVKLRGGTHLEWTNLVCTGQATMAACFKARANAALIVRYAAGFLDRYLKDARPPLLASDGQGLEAYRVELH